MARLEDLVSKQKLGAQFVLSAPMLGVEIEEFDKLAKHWLLEGGPGFSPVGVPFRKVVDGEFLIQRLTVIRSDAN